ncbi:MAG: hypothetical protein R2831_02585 [Chitinophagaceae bacterium]
MLDHELAFVQKLHDKQSRDFSFALRLVFLICILIPLLAGLLSYFKKPDLQSMLYMYGFAQLLVTVLLFAGLWIYYLSHLRKYKLDIKHRKKTQYVVSIKEKSEIEFNHTFHFFIHHPLKYSIEVSENDFHFYQVGDELAIEFSKYSKEYLGYV